MKNQILLLTHGEMSKGTLISIRVITGEENTASYICVLEDDSPSEIIKKIKIWLEQTNPMQPRIIITDIPFGSTTTLATPLIKKFENLHIVTGLNLALVLGIINADFSNQHVKKILVELVEQSKTMISYVNNLLTDIDEKEEDF